MRLLLSPRKVALRNYGGMGLLATNTIAQGDTREVGLDQITEDDYAITRAVPSRKWPGDANLKSHMSGCAVVHGNGPSVLDEKAGAWNHLHAYDPWRDIGLPQCPCSANARQVIHRSNKSRSRFRVRPGEADALIASDCRNRDVLFPYLNGEDFNSRPDQSPSRWIINFRDWPIQQAEDYPECMR